MSLNTHDLQEQSIDELTDWVKANDFGIQLNGERLSFLIAIAVLNEQRFDDELSEGEIHDAFAMVTQHFESSGEASSFRANNALNELVQQKLISRFTSEESESVSIYRLSPLASGITHYYLQHKAFSNLKLSIQLALVSEELLKALEYAKTDGDNQYWRKHVFGTLKYSVSETLDQIDLNQRVMDEQQQTVKEQVAQLLNIDWREAISECEKLLTTTSNTLSDLQTSLQSAGDNLQTYITDLLDLVYGRSDLGYIESILNGLQTKLDRLISWGQQSIDLWIGYDRHVHKFIRTVIDMDKNRAFGERLRQSILEFEQNPWHLVVAEGSRITELRDESMVLRNDEVRGYVPSNVEYESIKQVSNELSQKVTEMLDQHKQTGQVIDLGALLKEYLTLHPNSQHFDIARLVVDQAVRLGYSESDLRAIQPVWQSINEHGAKVQANVIDKY